MAIDAALPRGSASDTLMTQVNAENVLAVHRVLRAQFEAMLTALGDAAWMNDIPRCADDPVSMDAREVFQPKVRSILDTHTAHCNEVREAAGRLLEAARQYGFTEEEIESAFRSNAAPVFRGPLAER